MVDLIKDIINEGFVKKHGLFGYNPPVSTYENRELNSFHDVYHIFSKSKAGLSAAYTNRPALNTELLVNIYQVVMSRIAPMDAEIARKGIPEKFDKTNADLTLGEVKAHNLGRRENLEESYLAESRGASLNMEKNDHSSTFYRQDNGALFDRISALPDHVIEYHTARASWLRENIYREYLREITDMTPVEIGNIDINRVMSRELNGERINFEQWRTQYLEPYREQHSKSENLLVSYREYTKDERADFNNNNETFQTAYLLKQLTADKEFNFADKGLPKYPWESMNSSDEREQLRYYDDLARANTANLSHAADREVVYVINSRNSLESSNAFAAVKPPYGSDGKLLEGIESCTAIVASKNILSGTGVEGVYTLYTNDYTHMHFPMPQDLNQPNWTDCINKYHNTSALQLTGCSKTND